MVKIYEENTFFVTRNKREGILNNFKIIRIKDILYNLKEFKLKKFLNKKI